MHSGRWESIFGFVDEHQCFKSDMAVTGESGVMGCGVGEFGRIKNKACIMLYILVTCMKDQPEESCSSPYLR